MNKVFLRRKQLSAMGIGKSKLNCLSQADMEKKPILTLIFRHRQYPPFSTQSSPGSGLGHSIAVVRRNWHKIKGHVTLVIYTLEKTLFGWGYVAIKDSEVEIPAHLSFQRIYMLDNETLLTRDDDLTKHCTSIYDRELQLQKRFKKDFGLFLVAFLNGVVAFARSIGNECPPDELKYEICLFDTVKNHSYVTTLSPSTGYTWGRWLSMAMCQVEAEGDFYAVVDSIHQATKLDIFDSDGQHLIHKHLRFESCPVDAVCGNLNNIFIMQRDPPAIHIFNWMGEQLNALDFKQLQLRNYQWAWMASPGVREDLLHVCVGDWPSAKYCLTYKIV